MTALITATVGSALVNGYIASEAAGDAADAQSASAAAEIAERRRQFDEIQKLLAPYVAAGPGALTAQQNIAGLGKPGAQRAAISAIENSPQFRALTQQGENAILQNASATGGLRGGNVQGALAQFRPAMLSQLIEQQYARLGGLTQLGQNSAVGVGNAGLQTVNGIGAALQSQGAAQAGGALGQGQAWANAASGIGGAFGLWAALNRGGPGVGDLPVASPAYPTGGIVGGAVLPNSLRGGF